VLEKGGLYLARICEWIVGLLMTVMTAVVLAGVYFRYIVGDALSWSELLSRYIMIWMTFLAASVLIQEEGHISITMLRDRLPWALRKALVLTGDVIIMVFLILWGLASLEAFDIVKYDISSALKVSLGWVFVSQPVCALLMLIQASLLLVRHLTERKPSSSSEPLA